MLADSLVIASLITILSLSLFFFPEQGGGGGVL